MIKDNEKTTETIVINPIVIPSLNDITSFPVGDNDEVVKTAFTETPSLNDISGSDIMDSQPELYKEIVKKAIKQKPISFQHINGLLPDGKSNKKVTKRPIIGEQTITIKDNDVAVKETPAIKPKCSTTSAIKCFPTSANSVSPSPTAPIHGLPFTELCEKERHQVLADVRTYFSSLTTKYNAPSLSVAQVSVASPFPYMAPFAIPQPKTKSNIHSRQIPHRKKLSVCVSRRVCCKTTKTCQTSQKTQVRQSNFISTAVSFILTNLSIFTILNSLFTRKENKNEIEYLNQIFNISSKLNTNKRACRNKVKLLQSKRKIKMHQTNQMSHTTVTQPLISGHEIKGVNNDLQNQLFTPVTIGQSGISTHVQLDSGASVNLMGLKLANKLFDLGLVNYSYENLESRLVDVQKREIRQPLRPINVTCIFNEHPINICYHVVENLDRPLLGLATMLSSNMSILNNNNKSFLLIGPLNDPKAVIENVKYLENDVLLLGDNTLDLGVNFVSCYSPHEAGYVKVNQTLDFTDSCIKIPEQISQVHNHKLQLQICNLTEQPFALREHSHIGTGTQLKQVNGWIEEDDRFSFPLSDEEAQKILESCEPHSIPIFDGNTEAVIDWEAALRQPGILPQNCLEQIISFVKTDTPNLFSQTEYDVGCLDKKYAFIEEFPLTTSVPVKSKPYVFNAIRSAQIKNTFDKLEQNGLLKKAHSPYATACLVVPKGDNRVRLVFDFRPFNKICLTSNQPVVRPSVIMQTISNAKPSFISTMDVSNAFQSIQLGEKAMLQASIVTSETQYVPTRLSFGYKNSPAIFLQAMQKVFMELPKDPSGIPYCLFYFDDIVIFSKTEEENVQHIKNVFELLHKVGLKLQPTKVNFFKQKVNLLGMEITGTTVSPQKKHIESIRNFPRPSNIKQLQSLLGLICWNHTLVANYSQVIQPLTKLLRKEVPFEWGPEQEQTLNYIKSLITDRTVAYFADYDLPFYLSCDASDKFVAGILYQVKGYTKEDMPAVLHSLQHTKELNKLPPPSVVPRHPLLPKGALGVPSPFTLTAEGIDSPHNPFIQSPNDDVELELEEHLDDPNRLYVICNVGFYSSSLSKSQANYSIIEKEAFAVISSLEFFKPVLQAANKVYVLSDSRPFLYILKMMKAGMSRLQRWSMKLFDLPFEVIMCHVKGTANYSDTLTRVWAVQEPDEAAPDMKKPVIVTSPFKIGQLITYDEMVEAIEKFPKSVTYTIKEKPKKRAPQVSQVKNVTTINYVGSSIVNEIEKLITVPNILTAQLSDEFCKKLENKQNIKYYKFQGLWYRKRINQIMLNSDGRIVVPRSLASPVIALFHMENHSGVTNICNHIKSVYFFPKMFETVREFINMCHLCAIYKACTQPRTPLGLRSLEPAPKGAIWSLDVVEGMSTYRNSGSYLSIVEYYTGYRIIVPLKYSTAAEVSKIIEKDIISTFGPPLLMISDGGSNLLKSQQVQKLLNFYGIQDHITTPYHPASHGRIEISHASITTLLKISSESLNKPWFELCPFVQLALNCRPSTTLGGKTPMYFMFGTENEYRRRKKFSTHDFPTSDEQKEIWRLHDKACRQVLQEYNQIRNKLNIKIGGKMIDYQTGQFIWAKNFTKIPKMKMKTKYLTEPLEVVKDFGHAVLAKNYSGIIFKLHKDNIKRYNAESLELYNALPFKTKMRFNKI